MRVIVGQGHGYLVFHLKPLLDVHDQGYHADGIDDGGLIDDHGVVAHADVASPPVMVHCFPQRGQHDFQCPP